MSRKTKRMTKVSWEKAVNAQQEAYIDYKNQFNNNTVKTTTTSGSYYPYNTSAPYPYFTGGVSFPPEKSDAQKALEEVEKVKIMMFSVTKLLAKVFEGEECEKRCGECIYCLAQDMLNVQTQEMMDALADEDEPTINNASYYGTTYYPPFQQGTTMIGTTMTG